MPNDSRSAEILIAGGGVMGAALAYWITRLKPGCDVVIVERDPSFQRASSSLSASSIRQQFSCAVNVSLSRFGFEFLRDAATHLSLDGQAPELSLHADGYLYLAHAGQAMALEAAHAVQTGLGAEIALLDPAELGRRFPWLNTEDLALGALGLSGEGWFDGPALHRALLSKALAQGARRLTGEVVGVHRGASSEGKAAGGADAGAIQGVVLADGRSVPCDTLVIAAGAWSARLARMAGEPIAISASRRTVFVLSSPATLPGCPLLIDPEGFWLRPEGRLLLTGAPPIETEPDLPLEPDWRELDEAQWMRIAHRIPSLAAMRIERAWAGYYDMHDYDHNALIGPSVSVPGLWYLCGFSGHGMQHAPGAGLALAEWMMLGRPSTVDVTPLSPQRVALEQPLIELNVIG